MLALYEASLEISVTVQWENSLTGLLISEDFHTYESLEFTENGAGKKEKFCNCKCLVYKTGPRIMARLVWVIYISPVKHNTMIIKK